MQGFGGGFPLFLSHMNQGQKVGLIPSGKEQKLKGEMPKQRRGTTPPDPFSAVAGSNGLR